VSSIYKLNVLFKSVRNIVQYNTGDASALVAVKTNGGDATYWSNSNNANSGAIQIGTNSTFATASVVTNGGNIVLGGGLPSSGNNNIPDGYAYGTIGVTLNDYSVLNTTATGVAGTINIRGSSNSSSGKGVQIGWSYGYAQLTGGEVSITGVSTHATSPSSGIDMTRPMSSISSSGAITLNGTGGSVTTATPGAYIQGSISSSGGTININGTTSGTRAAIQLLNTTLNAAGSDITLTAVGGRGIWAQTGTSLGQSGSTTQNVKFITDQVSFLTSGS
jgi:hypothetical protein